MQLRVAVCTTFGFTTYVIYNHENTVPIIFNMVTAVCIVWRATVTLVWRVFCDSDRSLYNVTHVLQQWSWSVHVLCSEVQQQQQQQAGSLSSTPHAFPPFQHPSHELLQENGFVWHVYNKYRSKCEKGGCHWNVFCLLRAWKLNVATLV